jgi:putative endonuclease
MVNYYVYMLASRKNGTLYTGVTSALVQRVWQHREEMTVGFTSKYQVKRLVYFEPYDCARNAIQREKNIKHWPRRWKIALIETINPDWRDLYAQICV